MPNTISLDIFAQRIFDRFGTLIYPVCLCVMLPMFMFAIVLEKEEKLLAFMRMNGMRMIYYWVSNFIFDWILYIAALVVFLIFAIVVLDLHCFIDSGIFMQIIIYIGFGYSQISVAFFFSVFTSNS